MGRFQTRLRGGRPNACLPPRRACAARDVSGTTVEPGRFKKTDGLAQAERICSYPPGRLARMGQRGQAPAGKAVLITFDYAYADLAEYVFPVLKEKALHGHGIRGHRRCRSQWHL